MRAAAAAEPADFLHGAACHVCLFVSETTTALAQLPQLADRLADMPQPALRRLYESLDLQIRYQPAERVLDVQITLTDAIGDPNELAPPDQRVGPASQVCSVHLIQGLSNPDWEARRLLGMAEDWRDRQDTSR